MTPFCFMASLDYFHAYYSIPVHHSMRKFLKFYWQGQLLQFTCLHHGLACAPRLFTKLLKPVYASLRGQGYQSARFIDDIHLLGADFQSALNNVTATATLIQQLGFHINLVKSVLVPTQIVEFLGFLLNSIRMTVSLTEHKAKKLQLACTKSLLAPQPTIRETAHVIGALVAAFPVVPHGQLFYRQLEIKTTALQLHQGDFDKNTVLV